MESQMGRQIDAAFTEYSDKLDAISFASPARRLKMIRKMGLTLSLLEESYGRKSRWNWTFVDVEARISALAKNLLDMRQIGHTRDPVMRKHSQLVMRLLQHTARRYRERFELMSKNKVDIYRAIDFLQAMKRICIIMGQKTEVEKVKKQIKVWEAQVQKA
jgi:hypothetical protein